MDQVFIDMRKENSWISKHFNKDLVSVEELLCCIEDLDLKVDSLQEELEEKEDRIEEMRKELATYDPSNYGYPYEWVERGGE